MKYLQLTFALFIVAVQADIHPNLRKLIDYTKQCMDIENASLDDSLIISSGVIPETREGLCMAACIAEKIGFIKDGKFSPEGAVEGVEVLINKNNPNNKKVMKHLKLLANECKSVEHEDRCELVLEIINCFNN